MRLRNTAVALAGLLAAADIWFGWPGSYSIAVMAVFLFALAWGQGAALLLSAGLLLISLWQSPEPLTNVFLAGAMGLAAWLGYELGLRVRDIEQHQRQLKSDLRAMLRAADRAGRYQDPEELLHRLPELLSDARLRKVCVFEVGVETRLLSGDCDPGELPVDPKNVLQDDRPGYYEGENAHLLLLPMCERFVVAVESSAPLDDDERSLIRAFVNVVCLMRQRLEENVEARHFGRLMEAMASSDRLEEAVEKVLQLLLPMLDASSGVVMIFRMGRFEPLAMAGKMPAAEEALLLAGLPAGWGGIWKSYISYRPLFISDYGKFSLRVQEVYDAGIRSLAFVPVSGERRARIVLVVQDERVREWTEEERDFLALVARGLGLMAEQFLVRERLDALLRLEREVLGILIDEAYETLMHYAVRLVPGAEAGSLLVRTDSGNFVYAAALGYDIEELRKITYTMADMRDGWYQAGREKWEEGEPRIISTVEQDIAHMSYKTAPVEVIDQAGRVREIKANLCFPIVYQGEVLALMNLDSFSDPEAFDEESVDVSRIFAQQTALLLHEQHYRRLLERAAHTDPLTGLPNRRAFDKDYATFWSSAKRYGYPLAILIIDLSGFKEVNDRFGHAAGDQALREVARVLTSLVRNGDHVYRWGGDEFAVLLPHTTLGGAVRAAKRYAAAIEKVCLEEHCIRANLGAAAFPEDAADPEELLALADSRMYQAKASGLVVEPRD